MIFFAIPRQRVRIIRQSIRNFLFFFFKGKLLDGAYRSAFEEAFARYIGTPNAVAVSSGRFALELILDGLALQPGDEVILPAYTFQAVPALIARMGLMPVFADVDLETYTMKAPAVEALITPKTRVIIATHLLGHPCDIRDLQRIAQNNHIFLVEDCAQAVGAEVQGQKVGSFGDAAIFSMETIKLMHTYGGGVITVSNAPLYRAIMRRVQGLGTMSAGRLAGKIFFTIFEHVVTQPCVFSFFIWPVLVMGEGVFSINLEKMFKAMKRDMKGMRGGRMTNYQAAVGLIELQDLDNRIARIGKKVALLKLFALRVIHPEDISLKQACSAFVIRTQDRASFKKDLLWHGMDSGFQAAQNCSAIFSPQFQCEGAGILERELLQIPVSEYVSDRDIIRMGEHIAKWGETCASH